MIKLWQGVAMRTGCDSQAGSIPTGLIVQFSDRTQLAMTPSDTGRASSRHEAQISPKCSIPVHAGVLFF
ncbi:hypothetical protein D0638_06365 [Lacticaseibacillus paracasei]|nr:hypothetical protein D0638_06365 [Lacticaseibacillus paracasei]RWZ65697.1 hypothetical protein EQK34_04985 [Lacticaseibacillus paracasei]